MMLDMAEGVNFESLRYGTPEWDDARRERRGHPCGDHIREEPQRNDEVVVSAMDESVDFQEAVALALARIKDKEPSDMSRTRWLPSDWGSSNTLTVLGMLVTLAVLVFGGYNTYRNDQQEQNRFNTETLGTLRSLASAIQANDTSDKERTLRYAPQIETAARMMDVTNTRLDNLAKSVADVRDQIQEIGKTQMQDHTDVQVLKSRMEEHGPAPRGN